MKTEIIEKILASDSLVQAGVWLATAEEMMSEQKNWAELDEGKNDFSTSKFWVTTDDGVVMGIDDDEDLERVAPDSDYFKNEF